MRQKMVDEIQPQREHSHRRPVARPLYPIRGTSWAGPARRAAPRELYLTALAVERRPS